MKDALGDMHNLFLWRSDAFERKVEVAEARLVRARLLRRHDPLEWLAKLFIGRGEQIVVAIRDDAQVESIRQHAERVRRIGKGGPVGH